MEILFSGPEREQYKLAVKKTKDVNERQRLCSLLSYDAGISIPVISKVLQLAESIIYRYIKEFKDSGKTKNEDRGGSSSYLSETSGKELKSHLSEKTYLYVKDIVAYVHATYDVKYSISGMCRWLKQQGFCYKKPATVPGKMDPQKQEAFQHQYQTLKKELKTSEVILFMDGVHPAYQSQAVGGWILKSEKRYLPTTGKQTRLHFMGALSVENSKVIMEEFKTINTDTILKFLKTIETSYPQASKIYTICDNAAYHKSTIVKDYLKSSRIELVYLPGYSPNLNPIERLWKLMKQKTTHNKYYEKFSDFTTAVRNFFTADTVKLQQLIAARINDKFHLFVPKIISL
jgi:transposase